MFLLGAGEAKCTRAQLTCSLSCDTQRTPHVSVRLRYGITHLLTCLYTLIGFPFVPSSSWIWTLVQRVHHTNFIQTRVVKCAMPEVMLLSAYFLHTVYTAFDTLSPYYNILLITACAALLDQPSLAARPSSRIVAATCHVAKPRSPSHASLRVPGCMALPCGA